MRSNIALCEIWYICLNTDQNLRIRFVIEKQSGKKRMFDLRIKNIHQGEFNIRGVLRFVLIVLFLFYFPHFTAAVAEIYQYKLSSIANLHDVYNSN